MRPDVVVLCYHAVSARWSSSLSVTPERLAEQVSSLLLRGYVPQTFTSAVLAPASPKVVAVTFDDAYRSVAELARPVLDGLGVVASVYAPTAFIGRDEPMSWPGIEEWLDTEHRDELLPLGWDGLAELAGAGWEVGSHTVGHPRLTTLGDAELAGELRASRAACEERLGRPCTSIAYPYGDEDARVVRAAGEAGYLAAGTLPHRLHAASPLRFPRIGVYQRDDPRRFRLKTDRPMRALRRSPAWELAERMRSRAARGRG